MKERFVKLSDIEEMLDNARIITDDEYGGYDTSDVRRGLNNMSIYEFEVSDETIEDKQSTVKQFVDDMFERLYERESRYDPDDNYLW